VVAVSLANDQGWPLYLERYRNLIASPA